MSLPIEIQEAMEQGELSIEQLKELIRLEAHEIDLTYEQAIALEAQDALPRNLIGSDLDFIIKLLPKGDEQ